MGVADELRERRGDPDDPFDQEAARREWRRGAGRRDRQERDEHAGDDDEARQAFHEGVEEGKRRSSSSSSTRSASPVSRAAGHAGGALDGGAGFLLGLIAYSLLLNYLRGGVPAVRGWIAAKFINKPYGGGLDTLAPTPAPAPADFGAYPEPAFKGKPVGGSKVL